MILSQTGHGRRIFNLIYAGTSAWRQTRAFIAGFCKTFGIFVVDIIARQKILLYMKNFTYLFVAVLFGYGSAIGQSGAQQWFQTDQVTFENYIDQHREAWALDVNADFLTIKQWQDDLELDHVKTQQSHQGVPVEGAILLLHGKNGMVTHANGHVVKGQFATASPQINPEEALLAVQTFFEPHQLYYEDPIKEAWIKNFKEDKSATFKPVPVLTYVNEKFSRRAEDYRLAWKIDVFVNKEIDREVVYIDALSGEVLFSQQACSSGCAKHDHTKVKKGMASTAVIPTQGTGVTRYIGTVDITTDSIADSTFILNDVTRGNGIRTYNALQQTDINQADDFYDDDNFWNNVNAKRDEAAIDAHHGSIMTYDYWQEAFGWSSYDGNGSRMICYVHWDQGWFNASWNGMFSRYGDGTGDPLTYIDIVAHEFTHGLTGTTAGLVYAYESGALNESFSDIFGTAVEHYALGDDFLWLLGIPHDAFRNMANPNSYGHPDTYLGRNWVTGTQDNGGVHTNSGVQNYWYYLLVNGGSGTNDNGFDYVVDSIGWEKASAIAFRNLTTYLTPSSQYYDARLGSLQAAADLYGDCSPEVVAVAQAWAAVGLGADVPTRDLQVLEVDAIESSCYLADEKVGISFRFNPSGCSYVLDSGLVIELGYRINDTMVISENIVLDKEIQEGELFAYEFLTQVDLSRSGKYFFDYWVSIDLDDFPGNDTIHDILVTKPYRFDNNSQMIFRSFSTSPDSFLTRVGDNAEAEIYLSTSNPKPGFLAYQLTGKDASPRNIRFPNSEEDNFVFNPEFGAELCFCLDLTDWDNFILNFDLRQTYSSFYRGYVGFDVPEFVSSMRVTIDGEQIGEQFHPSTYTDDEWESHQMDLSQFVGQTFELCFEGKHFLDRATDRAAGGTTEGDNTFIDNIEFTGKTNVSTRDLLPVEMSIVPNPTSGKVKMTAHVPTAEDVKMSIYDVNGKLMTQRTLAGTGGIYEYHLNVDTWTPGVYTVVWRSDIYQSVGRLVVEK